MAPIVPATAANPPIQSKKVKEMIDRRKNWMFMEPDELVAGPTTEEILGVSKQDEEGEESENLSVLARYYERLERAAAGETNSVKESSNSRRDSERERDWRDKEKSDDLRIKDSSQPVFSGSNERGSSERDETLKNMLGAEAASKVFAPSKSGLFSDVFGLNAKAPQAVDKSPQMTEFMQLLKTRAPSAPPTDFGSAFGAPAARSPLPGSAFGSGFSPKESPVFGTIAPPAAADFSTKAPASSLAPALPAYEPPKLQPPPTFSTPRRKF